MKLLVVGGTGMIGTHAARHLRDVGHDVSISSRRPAEASAEFEQIVGDYVERSFTPEQLAAFDAVVFAAGQDVRHTGGAVPDAAFWRATQIEGVPAFAALARDAGVKRFVQIGSYYHQVMPELVATNPYVEARKLADEGARALASADFNVSTINPPSIVGVIPGASLERYRSLIAWGRGEKPGVPFFAPAGGTNYLSAGSLAEAIADALENAETGRAYLVGDENLTFRAFFQLIFDAAGSATILEERDESHPMLPDNYIVHGRGVTLAYQPEDAGGPTLNYTRNDIRREIESIVARADQ